ncbi:MAG: FHA domain-containing protein [Planctomycetes bacterium]|nr:FHA domain-containing protein [Planctomycetota bacterium]
MPQPPNTHDPHSVRGPHGLQNLPQVELEIVRGAARARKRRVTGPAFLIGRALDSDLVLGDPQFPEAHCYILIDPRGVTIRHMGDGPRLLVNDEEVSTQALCDGDTIGTGPYEFLVCISPPPYHGRPFGDSDQAEVDVDVAGELEASDGEEASGGMAMSIAFPRSPDANVSLTGEQLAGSLKLPHWLRPPLPSPAVGDATCAPPQHFRNHAGAVAPAANVLLRNTPKQAV